MIRRSNKESTNFNPAYVSQFTESQILSSWLSCLHFKASRINAINEIEALIIDDKNKISTWFCWFLFINHPERQLTATKQKVSVKYLKLYFLNFDNFVEADFKGDGLSWRDLKISCSKDLPFSLISFLVIDLVFTICRIFIQ